MRAAALPVGRCGAASSSACRRLGQRAARPQAPRTARAPLRPRAIAEAEKPAAAAAGGPLTVDITQARLAGNLRGVPSGCPPC